MLDIHPEPIPASVEIRTPTDRIPLNPLIDTTGLFENVHAARALLNHLVDEGYFALEETTSFAFVSHFDSVEALLALREQRGSSAPLDEAVVAEARRLLRQPGGELRISERVSARRLRRLSTAAELRDAAGVQPRRRPVGKPAAVCTR